MRIGLFPGSFNPIHNGHLEAADTAMSMFELDYVFFIVEDGPMKEERIFMCSLATSNNDKFYVAHIPEGSKYPYCLGLYYKAEEQIQLQFNDSEKYVIMGEDALYRMEYLNLKFVKNPKLLVCNRDTTYMDKERFLEQAKLHELYWFSYRTGNDTSSSYIRRAVRYNYPYRYKLQTDVYEHIIQNNLYKEPENADIQGDTVLGLREVL